MIKVSKKTIGVITGTSVAVIAGGALGANFLLAENNNNQRNVNPLNRDSNYHYYSISNKMLANNDLNSLISVSHQDGLTTYSLDESKFTSSIKNIVRNSLSKIPAFKHDYLNYVIDVHYLSKQNSIDVDLVWYKEKSKYRYFDQFQIILEC